MTFIELLRCHVKTPFLTAFAYGSAVFKQQQSLTVTSGKMIDYLVVVEDDKLAEWHESNCSVNPRDYPLLGRLAVSKSKIFNDAVYYVPGVEVKAANGEDKLIKYGVLGWEYLLRDLYTWETMFLAGRLQKPTIRSDIVDSEMQRILQGAMEYNLDSAVRTALLIDPKGADDFSRLLKVIVSLSYTNDPRLLLAESPQKVENIVKGQRQELEAMYLQRYEQMKKGSEGAFGDPMCRIQMIGNLPWALKTELTRDSTSLWQVALNTRKKKCLISEAIGRIVRRSAWKQMILGAVSTPIDKSINYAIDKVKKRFQ